MAYGGLSVYDYRITRFTLAYRSIPFLYKHNTTHATSGCSYCAVARCSHLSDTNSVWLPSFQTSCPEVIIRCSSLEIKSQYAVCCFWMTELTKWVPITSRPCTVCLKPTIRIVPLLVTMLHSVIPGTQDVCFTSVRDFSFLGVIVASKLV